MKYDCVKHALTRDNGALVATLAPGVSTEEGFAMADGFIGGNVIATTAEDTFELMSDLREQILGLEEEVDDLNEQNKDLRDELDRLRDVIKELRAGERVPVGTEVAP